MVSVGPEVMSFGRRIPMLAAEHPDKIAIVFAPKGGPPERPVSWRELDRTSNRMARLLERRGLDASGLLAVALHNRPEHLMLTIAGWKLGACVLPLSPSLPGKEREQTLEAARPRLVVADWEDAGGTTVVRAAELERIEDFSDAPLPDRIPHPGKAIPSGGSTGRSKIIVKPDPWLKTVGKAAGERGHLWGFRPGQTQLITTRLYHNMPFNWSTFGLFDDHTIVLMEHFDAGYAIDLIERYRVDWSQFVPIIMKRIAEHPDFKTGDLSSLRAVFHSGAPCPPWLKRVWMDLVGPKNVWEAFGGAEDAGVAVIRGDDWLRHPGSVGWAWECAMKILDEDFQEVPRGEVGEIFMRPHDPTPTYRYLGSPPAKTTPDGFISLGDLGSMDGDGYLYHADRRMDLIVSGGANIYPAEVEAALSEHPDVVDLAVIPVPDDEWGKRVHAIIQPRDPASPPALEELDRHCRARVAAHKCPKSYEFIETLPREPTGKIRRSALAAERESGWTPAMLRVGTGAAASSSHAEAGSGIIDHRRAAR